MKNVRKFIEAGDKVKVTLRFRGREMAHQELGAQVLQLCVRKWKNPPALRPCRKMEGRQMVMVLAPV